MMRTQTKTFQEIIEDGYTFPEYIPQQLQDVITSWYQFRHVCDDERFNAFFDRVLYRDFDRYEELLRIDPTISDYDWLVEQYRERLLERQASGTATSESENSGTKSTTHGHIISSQDTNDKNEVTTHGHTVLTVTDDDGEKSTNSVENRTIDINDSETDTLLRSMNDRVVHNGETTGETTNPGYTDSTEETTDTKALGKEMPMSNTYSGGGMPGSLNWENPSTQTETDVALNRNASREYDASTETSGTEEYTTSDTASGTDTRSITRDNGKTDDVNTTKNETYENDKSVSTTNGGTDRVTTDADSTHAETHSGTDTETNNGASETTATKSESGTDKEIYTGRQEDPATILRRASAYIANSSAWEWLKSRLDVCFIQVYDVDMGFLYW